MMPIMIMWEVKNAQRFSFRCCNGTCEKLGLKVENIQKKPKQSGPLLLVPVDGPLEDPLHFTCVFTWALWVGPQVL